MGLVISLHISGTKASCVAMHNCKGGEMEPCYVFRRGIGYVNKPLMIYTVIMLKPVFFSYSFTSTFFLYCHTANLRQHICVVSLLFLIPPFQSSEYIPGRLNLMKLCFFHVSLARDCNGLPRSHSSSLDNIQCILHLHAPLYFFMLFHTVDDISFLSIL